MTQPVIHKELKIKILKFPLPPKIFFEASISHPINHASLLTRSDPPRIQPRTNRFGIAVQSVLRLIDNGTIDIMVIKQT